MRILLVRLSALGDVTQALHVLSTLRARAPEAYIGWLAQDDFASILQGHPQLDRLHVYRRRELKGWVRKPWVLAGFRRLLVELRGERYDVALDLQGNLKSGYLTCWSGARRTVGTGPPLSREGHGLFVRRRITPPEGHRLEAYYALLDEVVGPGPRAHAVLPSEPSHPGAIVLQPGTSAFGAFKRWPPEFFAELGDRLADRLDAPVLVVGRSHDMPLVRTVIANMRHPASNPDTPSLRTLIDLLAGARIVVAGDTGALHIAGALGVPTLGLFGPKDPEVFGPAGARVRTVRTGVRCSPCALRFCPDPVCMTGLTVEQVEREALALLEEAA